MAQHDFCDPDQARWVGIRPAIDGEPLMAYGGATDSGSTIYTVPVNKKLYLFNWNCSVRNAAATSLTGFFILQNSTPATIYRFFTCRVLADSGLEKQASYFLPMICDAGYSFLVFSGGALFDIYANIHGVLADA